MYFLTRYREGLSKPSPEEYNLIRASRLTNVARWFAEQNIEGNAVIKVINFFSLFRMTRHDQVTKLQYSKGKYGLYSGTS